MSGADDLRRMTQLEFFPPPAKRGVVSLEVALDDMAAHLSKQRGYTVVRAGTFVSGYWLARGVDPQHSFSPISETLNTRRVA